MKGCLWSPCSRISDFVGVFDERVVCAVRYEELLESLWLEEDSVSSVEAADEIEAGLGVEGVLAVLDGVVGGIVISLSSSNGQSSDHKSAISCFISNT